MQWAQAFYRYLPSMMIDDHQQAGCTKLWLTSQLECHMNRAVIDGFVLASAIAIRRVAERSKAFDLLHACPAGQMQTIHNHLPISKQHGMTRA